MKLRLIILFFCGFASVALAQKKSKGDILFFEYAYQAAITEYQKEAQKKPLTNQQQLNLADAYFKTQAYKNAAKVYLEVYKKDSTMSTHHFNKMLQSFSKDSGKDRVKAFLATKSNVLSNELLENANFNYELLASDNQSEQDFNTFNISGNSPQSDFSPSFYKDKLLFTTARAAKAKKVYGPSGESYLDIYIGLLRADGDVLTATPFTQIPVGDFHEGTPFYSKSLDKVFYIRSNTENGELAFDSNGKNALGIGMTGSNDSFQFLLRDLSTSFYYPFYEEATGKLYFAANFEDSYGGTDIYFVYTNQGQIMSAPVNLGPKINSPANEIAPFVFENSLYFASDVFYGLGGMDIYKTNIQDEDSFSIPVNLGAGVNSSADDFGFIIKNNNSKGFLGYFSSNRAGGKGNDDIYGFQVAEKPGLKTIVLRGEIRNLKTNQNVSKAAIRIYDESNNLIKEVYSDDNGFYQIEVPDRKTINIEVVKERFSRIYNTYSEDALAKIQDVKFDIGLTKLDDLVERKEAQTIIKLRKFFFNRGGWTITPEIETELDKVVKTVQMFPEVQLGIESHTDSRGGSSTNLRISQRRSDAIKNYLLGKGVPPSAILNSLGYGEDKIQNNCKNGVYCVDVLHKQNERSLIVILNYNVLFENF